MDKHITGSVIKRLRENKNMTQEELAEKIFVSSKTVSKWETGQGFPDISLIEPLAKALNISVIELFSGSETPNLNLSSDITKSRFYVCPVCSNIIISTGGAVISCCGNTLNSIETVNADLEHNIIQILSDTEYYVTVNHPMSKEHYISFLAAVSDDRIQFVKLYPQGPAEARFTITRIKHFYIFCNKHGLFAVKSQQGSQG